MRGGGPAGPSPAIIPRPLKVLLVAALLREVRPFLRRVKAQPREGQGAPTWEFAVGGEAAALVLSGMGPAKAFRVASAALGRYGPQALISLGFGGALTLEVAPGDVVLGETVWQYDPESGGLAAAAAPEPPRPLPELLSLLHNAGLPALAGSLVSTPAIIRKATQGGPLKELPRPVLDLESASLAELAAARGLAFLGLRAVTDGAGEEIPEFFREACLAGKEPGPGAAFSWAARDPGRLLVLLRLWSRSRAASHRLDRALEVLLPTL